MGHIPFETKRFAHAAGHVTDGDLAAYSRTEDLLRDPALSPSRKRALLAHWASDIHAVAGAPGLRSVQGVTVTVDSLFAALQALDAEPDQAAVAAADRQGTGQGGRNAG